jgi:type I restriction enzyme M protein
MLAEQQTEWIINNNLVNKGWHIDGDSKLKNVYFQKPPYLEQQKQLKGKKPDYILYETGTNKPIAIIEAKKSGVNLEPALEQGTEYAKALDVPLVFAMNGAYCETRFIPNGKNLILNGEEVRELIREKEALAFLNTNSNEAWTIPQEVKVSRDELISQFRNLNDVLRSEGLRAGIERFSEFANILFLKLLSEDNAKSWWNSIKSQSNDDIIGYINSYVINQIQTKYGGDVFTPISIKNPQTLRHIIDAIDPLVLSTIDTDIKGDAFEYFLEKTTSTENDLGEYFTPRNVVRTIINLVDPKFKESIYDPFCGTGGFLTEAFNYVKENNIIKDDEDITRLKYNTLYGREITTTARIAKMNMVLHGDGHSGIQQINTLENPDYLEKKIVKNQITGKEEEIEEVKKFDVIVTNMPFSQTITRKTTENGKTKIENNISPLYYNGIAKNNGDAACVLHCLRSLKEGGRMALVVPEGFLFRKDIANVRKFLLSKAKLQSVISLPQGAFLPYTGVKTDILYFIDAHKPNNQKDYWYFDAKNIGVTLNNHQRKISGNNDLKKIESSDIKRVDKKPEFKENMLEIGFEIVPMEKIKNNDYNLVGSVYKEITRNGKYNFCRLSDILDFSRGFSYKSSILSDSGISMYNLKSIKKDLSPNHDFKYIKQEVKIADRYKCNKNDLLMAITDLTPTSEIIGRTTLVKENGIFSMDLAKIIINESLCFFKYLHYVLNSDEFLLEARKFSVGNNVKHLNLDSVLSIQIPLPSLAEQKKIVKLNEQKEKEIKMLQEKIEQNKQTINQEINQVWESKGSDNELPNSFEQLLTKAVQPFEQDCEK